MHAHDTERKTAERRRTDIEPNKARVPPHCRLRVMQRLGVIESAAEHVRELLTKATPVEDERFPAARAYRCGGVTIVVDEWDNVVKTVVKEVER